MSGSPADLAASSQRVRLHISPFNPELLDRIVGPSLKPLASNVSFHTVETFPERGFGYVELPSMEAQKLKKKLNGMTLKGTKVKIEEAKPEKKRKADDDVVDEERKSKKKARKEKKIQEEGVLPGHELEEGRRVKRGWKDGGEETKSDGEKRKKSEDANGTSEGRKLRFKAAVPDAAPPMEDKTKEKSKKKDKVRKKDKKTVVVEEFKRSSKPTSHTRVDSAGHGALVHVDGKGWVNEAGDVVEAEPTTRRSKRRKDKVEDLEPPAEPSEQPDVTKPTIPEPEAKSQSSDSDDDEHMSLDGAAPEPAAEAGQEQHQAADVVEKAEDDTEPAKEVHPLEALFKRPTTSPTSATRPKPMPIDTSFSFFTSGATEEESEDTGMAMPPQTPHTQRDLEWRSVRSAAPTPDTAAIGRHFSFPFADADEDDEDEGGQQAGEAGDVDMEDAPQAHAGAAEVDGRAEGEESAFTKRFYEQRGEFNRGWKKRRRDERKSKRQRENKRLNRQVA